MRLTRRIFDSLSNVAAWAGKAHSQRFVAGNAEGACLHAEQPIAVLFGWLNSSARNLKKYSDWYHSHDIETITILPKPSHVTFPLQANQVANGILDIITHPNIAHRPILVHGFSVGAYLFGQVICNAQKRDLIESLNPRMRACVFDSPVDVEGIPKGMSAAITQNPLLRYSIWGALELFLAVNRPAVRAYQASSQAFKANHFQSPTHVMYSHIDPVTDSDRIEQVMSNWQNMGIPVSCSVFDKSRHVEHGKLYYDDYFAALHTFLEKHVPEHFDWRQTNLQAVRVDGM